MKKVGFGTDGWRGEIAGDFTVANLRSVVRAIAQYILSTGRRGTVIIGYDTRFMSEYYASVAAGVVCAYGLKAILPPDAVTSPMLSNSVVSNGAAGGIMVTASHNPWTYNGIKFKAPYGGSANPEITRKIESYLTSDEVASVPYDEALRAGSAVVSDLYPEYARTVFGMVGMDHLRNSGLRVMFDCMHGAAGPHAPAVFRECGIEAGFMRTDRDPYFEGGSPEPMERNLDGLISAMAGDGYDIGFATDGDADRLGVVSPDGRFVSPHLVAALITLHLVRNRGLWGAIARTVSMSSLMDRIASKFGLAVIETPVGFKNICELMLGGDILVGCEENGGLGVKGYIPERDGILGALLLLEMMTVEKKGLLELLGGIEEEFGRSYYERCDIPLSAGVIEMDYDDFERVVNKSFGTYGILKINRLDGVKAVFGDGSWILFRRSGTEPVMRVYCESESPDTVRALVERAMEVLIG